MKISGILTTVLLTVLISFNSYAKDPGEKVEDFTIVNYDGTQYNLSKALQNGYVVIMFW